MPINIPATQPGRIQPGGPSVQPGYPGATRAFSPITDYPDPRQGLVLSPDTDPAGVDPRQGQILPPPH